MQDYDIIQGIFPRNQKNGIEVDFFDLDFVERIRESNKDFIEQHENQEEQPPDIDKEFKGSSNKTNEILSTASVDDLSIDEIRNFNRVKVL